MINITSLRVAIAYRLVVPVFIIILLEASLSYYVALHFVDKTYDRWLFDSALSLAQEVKAEGEEISVNLPATALDIFRWDEIDTTFFKIHAEKKGWLAGDALISAPLMPVNANQPIFSDVRVEGKATRMVSLMIPGNLPEKVYIHVAETLNKRQEMMLEILLADLIPHLILTVLIGLLLYEGITHGLKPLNELAEDIAKRSSSDLNPIPDSHVFSEVRILTDTINRLFAKLNSAISTQQRFIDNAAHQLRTPLAGLKLQAERARREDSVEAMQPALLQIQTSADRASHLVKQLLALARSGAVEAKHQFEEVDLSQLIKQVCMEWAPKAIKKDIELSFEASDQPFIIQGAKLLLKELMVNLLDNAINYGVEGGRIVVKLDSKSGVLIIEDDGPGIQASERKKIFERFYRTPGSPGNGCGLGLAIVKEIADLHRMQIELEQSDLGGVCIDLKIPASAWVNV